jgi:ABC-type antimicrobial peptide transport system permease subunit
LTLLLLELAAGLALLLGFVGIYGVISYSVSQRTREIGIPACPRCADCTGHNCVCPQRVDLSAIGCACGLAAALLWAPLMKSLLFSVSPSDPLTCAAMSASLIFAAALASYPPARKATKIDPVEALRAE